MTERKPEWWLVKLDERMHWREDLQARTKHIYGVYAFNRSVGVHLCELTASYELNFITHDAEFVDDISDELREDTHEWISGALIEEWVTYMHCSRIEQLMKEHPELFKRVELDDEELEEHPDQKLIDYINESWSTGALMY